MHQHSSQPHGSDQPGLVVGSLPQQAASIVGSYVMTAEPLHDASVSCGVAKVEDAAA
jgi:hypothetical protein